MDAAFPISGYVAPGFAPVRDAFAANFAASEELGASFALCIEGEVLVDLHGGHADRKRETLWDETALPCIYSTGKAVLALLIAREADRGALDYEKPVADYWPEFAAAGKDTISVGEALSHQAGLCGFTEEMAPQDWLDWDLICARLAAMAPLWEPGSANGYHPQTFGFIAGELLRRASGQTVGALLRREAAVQGVEIFCGLGEAELARAAPMQKPPKAPDLGVLNEFTKAAFLKPWSAPAKVAREAWAAAEIPASNMHANARSLAMIAQPFANKGLCSNGAQFMAPAIIEEALRVRIHGADLVLPFTLSWAAGVMANSAGHFGPSASAFGHAGFGGSCLVFDPAHGASMAYVMNKMSPHLVGDPRSLTLINAAYECL